MWDSWDCPVLIGKPVWKRVYVSPNTFGLERSLGMALMWPEGEGTRTPALL